MRAGLLPHEIFFRRRSCGRAGDTSRTYNYIDANGRGSRVFDTPGRKEAQIHTVIRWARMEVAVMSCLRSCQKYTLTGVNQKPMQFIRSSSGNRSRRFPRV